METETRKFIKSCIEQKRGDDLNRAKTAFANCTPEQMNEKYGESGQTRQQIIDGYKEREAKCDNAITEVENTN